MASATSAASKSRRVQHPAHGPHQHERLGQPGSWTDDLPWHQAVHTVDLSAHRDRWPVVQAHPIQGPIHPTLGIAMDLPIQLQAANGAICTLGLSFNNDGPPGTFFRYIGYIEPTSPATTTCSTALKNRPTCRK
jgi:hypothetical protein